MEPSDVESLLGCAETIRVGHPDLSRVPSDVVPDDVTWLRWHFESRVLLVGIAKRRDATFVRLRH
jgi:hypothetical protein